MSGFLLVGSANKSNWEKAKETWHDATTHRAWRHTVGRISCIARIPIYAIGILAQGAKTVIKGIVSPFVSLGRHITGSEKLESWSFNGVARDAIMTGTLIDRTLNSALCVLCAPPKSYRSIWQVIMGMPIVVFLEPQHGKDNKNKAKSPENYFKETLLKRPQYHKQIVQCESICHNGLYPDAISCVRGG